MKLPYAIVSFTRPGVAIQGAAPIKGLEWLVKGCEAIPVGFMIDVPKRARAIAEKAIEMLRYQPGSYRMEPSISLNIVRVRKLDNSPLLAVIALEPDLPLYVTTAGKNAQIKYSGICITVPLPSAKDMLRELETGIKMLDISQATPPPQ